jgi:hypothetical protein
VIQFIRRPYGTTCTACGATVLGLDAERHRAWHAQIAAQLQQAGTRNDHQEAAARDPNRP